MEILNVLVGARAALISPESWCQGCSTRQVKGKNQICLHNAINISAPKVNGGRRVLFEKVIELLGGSTYLVTFNDSSDTSHKDVIGLLDNTILKLEQHKL